MSSSRFHGNVSIHHWMMQQQQQQFTSWNVLLKSLHVGSLPAHRIHCGCRRCWPNAGKQNMCSIRRPRRRSKKKEEEEEEEEEEEMMMMMMDESTLLFKNGWLFVVAPSRRCLLPFAMLTRSSNLLVFQHGNTVV